MMRIGRIVIGVAGLGLAALLCAPLAVVVWVCFVDPPGRDPLVSLFFIGGYSFSGWQLWVVLAVLASLGGAIFVFAIYALISKKDDT